MAATKTRQIQSRVLAVFLASLMLLPAPGWAAPPSCSQPGGATDTCNAIDSIEAAETCLAYATSFANSGVARDCVEAGGVQSFEGYLQPSYEPSVSSPPVRRYSEARTDAVLRWALEPTRPRSLAIEQLIYEASLRQASAHGMFGDHQWVVAQNARTSMALGTDQWLGNPGYERLVRMDSRVCQDVDSSIPLTSGSQPALCQTDRDCQGERVCRAARFHGSDGLYGAVQEYRRGEQALLRAVRVLGLQRFQQLDAAPALGASCPGGCATRLLLRLGALRSQAQDGRLREMWGAAVAQGAAAPSTEGTQGPARCAAPLSMAGLSCSLDRDCDELPGDGLCGEGRERAFVRLRQTADEALSESTLLSSHLAQIAPELAQIEQAAADFDLLEAAQESMSLLMDRSERSLTPFGIPSDVVPFFSNTARDMLECEHTSRMTDCVLPLLESDWLGILGDLETLEGQADDRLDQYFSEAQNRDTYEVEAATLFQEAIERMFGPASPSAECTLEEQERGTCMDVPGFGVWEIAGVDCDSQYACSTQGVNGTLDGELERQFQVIRTAELEMQGLEALFEFLDRKEQHVIEHFYALQQIESTSCDDVQAAMEKAGNQINSELEQLKKDIKDRKVNLIGGTIADTLGFAGKGVGVAGSVGALAGSAFFGVGAIVGAAVGAVVGFFKGIFGGRKRRRQAARMRAEKIKQIETDRRIREIERQRDIDIHEIHCLGDSDKVQLALDDALFDLQGERDRLLALMATQSSRRLEAEIVANEMVESLRRARRRYDESVALNQIWDADDFRNPQNYRVLALKDELEATKLLEEARLRTWIMLRAAAYDLAEPDYTSPVGGFWGQIAVPHANDFSSCQEWDFTSGCAVNRAEDGAGCEADGPLLPEFGEVQQSDGSCSLQAVYQARSARELKSLVRDAYLDVAFAGSTLCGVNHGGTCYKEIHLRELFTDPLDGARRTLGEVAWARSGAGATLDFGVTLNRDYSVCTGTSELDWRCDPIGITGIISDYNEDPDDPLGSGPAWGLNDQTWNARIWSVSGKVSYEKDLNPKLTLCRDNAGFPTAPAGLTPKAACTHAFICADVGGTCRSLDEEDPSVTIRLLGTGMLRSQGADLPDIPGARDSIVRYRPLEVSEIEFQSREGPYQRRPFSASAALTEENFADPSFALKGLPVANDRWQISIDVPGDAEDEIDAYLAGIEDIVLRIEFEALQLD